jgi:hypothetical protein
VTARVLPVPSIENLSCIENHFNKSSVINMPIVIEDIIIGKVVMLDKDYSLVNPAFSSRSGEHLVVLSLDKSESTPKASILVTDNKEDAMAAGNIVSQSEVTQEEHVEEQSTLVATRVLAVLPRLLQRRDAAGDHGFAWTRRSRWSTGRSRTTGPSFSMMTRTG